MILLESRLYWEIAMWIVCSRRLWHLSRRVILLACDDVDDVCVGVVAVNVCLATSDVLSV